MNLQTTLKLPTTPRAHVITNLDGTQIYGVDPANPLQVSGTFTPSGVGYGTFDTQQVSVGITPTLIAAANAARGGLVVTNPSTTITVFIGSSAVTISTGQALLPGNSITIPTTADVYGVVAASTQTVSFLEVV